MLSKQLLKLRTKAGLTQAELAILSSVPQTTISAIEGGITENPTYGTIDGLARALAKKLGQTKPHVIATLMN